MNYAESLFSSLEKIYTRLIVEIYNEFVSETITWNILEKFDESLTLRAFLI